MRNRKLFKIDHENLRNFLFGAEDSLVSTVGFLFGLASTNDYTSYQIALAGIVLLSVESLSMGAGAFLTESELTDLDKKSKLNPLLDGLIMFFAYFLTGIITLLPYIFTPPLVARFISVLISFSALYVLGYLPTKRHKSGVRMLAVAGSATLIGFAVAKIFN